MVAVSDPVATSRPVSSPTVLRAAAKENKENNETRLTAVVMSLAVRLASAESANAAAKLLADVLAHHLEAEQVAVGWIDPRRMRARLAALSHVDQVSRHTETGRLLEDCLTEALPLTPVFAWSTAMECAPTIGLKSLPELAAQWRVGELTAFQIRDRGGAAIAVCLIGRRQPDGSIDESFLTLVGQVAGPLFNLLRRGTFSHWCSEWRRRLPKKAAWCCGGFAVFALAAMLLVAWPARTSCSVVLEPRVHRLVVAPFEGVFDQSQVKPGDLVQAEQLLGQMDGSEVRTRLAALEADIARSEKARDTHLATGKLADAQIDRLQVQRFEHERDVLAQRLKKLEIRSPIAGVVVSGDLTRHQGATVKIGQSLYEVAPLDQLVAEIAIPEEDFELTPQAAQCTLRLDALAGDALEGRIERLHPRAEQRDNRQVFIAELTLQNAGDLRPGMKGSATIQGPRLPLGWLLVRKPINAVRRFLGW